MGIKDRVCAGRLEQLESDQGLGDEAIPFLRGKVWVARSDSGAKMIFECADCTFIVVVVVGVQGDKLKVNVVFAEGFLHGVGALVVEDVDSGGFTMLA